jgi:DNA-binding IclR family transcriptional regulator
MKPFLGLQITSRNRDHCIPSSGIAIVLSQSICRRCPLPRPALSASRAIKVLNHLAAHPGDSFTLSELARETEVNVASLHAVLDVLTQEAYVVRDLRRKAYRLGASPIALGQAALDEHPAIQLARSATAELAESLQLEVLCGLAVGKDLLTVGEAGRPDRLYTRPRVGARLPFMPPLGILGVGYLEPAQQQAWLDRLGPTATAADREAYLDSARAARRSGYQIDLETPTRHQLALLMPELAQDPRSPALRARLEQLVLQLGHEQHILLEPQPGASYEVNNITAPILDARGALVCAVTILGFEQPVPAEQIQRYVRVLLDTTERITRTTGGRQSLDLEAGRL